MSLFLLHRNNLVGNHKVFEFPQCVPWSVEGSVEGSAQSLAKPPQSLWGGGFRPVVGKASPVVVGRRIPPSRWQSLPSRCGSMQHHTQPLLVPKQIKLIPMYLLDLWMCVKNESDNVRRGCNTRRSRCAEAASFARVPLGRVNMSIRCWRRSSRGSSVAPLAGLSMGPIHMCLCCGRRSSRGPSVGPGTPVPLGPMDMCPCC